MSGELSEEEDFMEIDLKNGVRDIYTVTTETTDTEVPQNNTGKVLEHNAYIVRQLSKIYALKSEVSMDTEDEQRKWKPFKDIR